MNIVDQIYSLVKIFYWMILLFQSLNIKAEDDVHVNENIFHLGIY